MYGATVAAGMKHIDRPIVSVTVMEYTAPGELQDYLRKTEGARYNEFTLSGFFDICDNVDAQCEIIRNLMETGIVAMALYYLGIAVKRLDRRVVETAEEIGFVLITMPPNQCNLRYSDAIMEITALIHKAREQETYFIPEVLDQFSQLPRHRQSIDVVLRIICDRAQISLIVTDAQWRVLSYATWPVGLQLDIQQVVEQVESGASKVTASDIQFFNQCMDLEHQGGSARYIVALSTEYDLIQKSADQVKELIRLFYNIWEDKQKNAGSDELVRSVIMGEMLKTKRVAELIGVDMRIMDSMWIFRPDRGFESKKLSQLMKRLRLAVEESFRWAALSRYEDSIILLGSKIETSVLIYFRKTVSDLLEEHDCRMRGFVVHNIREIPECREFYGKILEYSGAAVQIFPQRIVMGMQEICFAEECCTILAKGDAAVRQYMNVLAPLDVLDKQLADILRETLAVYLLDEDCSISSTAAHMYVHQNTVKYRINKINDLMCAHVRQIPLSLDMSRALALKRLLG